MFLTLAYLSNKNLCDRLDPRRGRWFPYTHIAACFYPNLYPRTKVSHSRKFQNFEAEDVHANMLRYWPH